jgi:septal ring factor EnvC (AmiA/AmiB activator)
MSSQSEESNRTNQNVSKELKNSKRIYRKIKHSHNHSKEQIRVLQQSITFMTSDKKQFQQQLTQERSGNTDLWNENRQFRFAIQECLKLFIPSTKSSVKLETL